MGQLVNLAIGQFGNEEMRQFDNLVNMENVGNVVKVVKVAIRQFGNEVELGNVDDIYQRVIVEDADFFGARCNLSRKKSGKQSNTL